jgi:hypothetical protein
MLTFRKSNPRLLQIRQRATFGKAARPPEQSRPLPLPAAVSPPIAAEEPEGSRRRSRRVTVSDNIGIRRIGSFNFEANLHNVSSGGCRVELIEQYDVGDRLVARFAKLEPLGARVCWTMGNTAGIEFLTNLHPAVFDTLVMRLSRPAAPGEKA